MADSTSSDKNQGPASKRTIAGLKATVHNPTMSEESKNKARERLKELGHEGEADQPAPSHQPTKAELLRQAEQVEGEHRHFGGLKATLKNPHVSEEAKEHAKKELNEHNIQI